MLQTEFSVKNTFKAFISILIVLAGIQIFRMAVQAVVWLISGRFGWSADIEIALDPLVYVLVGLSCWLVFRPNATELGLLPFPGKRMKVVYIILACLLGGMILFSGTLASEMLAENLRACLIFPLFEEPIFRGWAWQKLEKSLPVSRWRGPLLVALTSILFSLWHIGYWDAVAHKMQIQMISATLLHIMIMKMAVTAVIGLAVGIVRWRGGNLYPAMLLHAFWNLFGR